MGLPRFAPLRATIAAFFTVALSAVSATPVQACSCDRPPLHLALEAADFVADLRVLEVRSLGDGGMLPGQYMLYRVERVYKTSSNISDGDEIWVYHQTCNSTGYDAAEVGGRRIWFMSVRRGVPEHHFCSTSLDSQAPVPHLLLESRTRLLQSRR